MASSDYPKGRNHTPIPQGPHTVGCADIMVGKCKDGTLMRLFYPSKVTSIRDEYQKWTPWFLGDEYTRGLAAFIAPSIPSLFSMLFNWQMRHVLTPAVWEAEVANGVFPVIVFSHGLSASRAMYSTLCSELASHGFFVAAVEHRDLSACATFTLNDAGEKEYLHFKTPEPNQKEYDLRSKQVQIRANESRRVLDLLEKLNKGGVENDLPGRFLLEQLVGRLDLSQPVISGHSFGGATAIQTLATDSRFKIGVVLDPWMFPLRDDVDTICEAVKCPLISISTEAFQSDANLRAMKKLEREENIFVTIKGTVHQNQCDTPFLVGPIGRVFAGASSPLDPQTAIDINNRLSLVFICKHLGILPSTCVVYELFLEEWKDSLIYGLVQTQKKLRTSDL